METILIKTTTGGIEHLFVPSVMMMLIDIDQLAKIASFMFSPSKVNTVPYVTDNILCELF